jgi:hypothetical protein
MGNIRIQLDDVFHCIDTEFEDNKMLNSYEFRECLDILLTPSQLKSFIEIDTRRTFIVSNKKYVRFKDYIKDNVW